MTDKKTIPQRITPANLKPDFDHMSVGDLNRLGALVDKIKDGDLTKLTFGEMKEIEELSEKMKGNEMPTKTGGTVYPAFLERQITIKNEPGGQNPDYNETYTIYFWSDGIVTHKPEREPLRQPLMPGELPAYEEPEVRFDGQKQPYFTHICRGVRLELPLDNNWQVTEHGDKISVQPHIECSVCTLKGAYNNGTWIPQA